MTIFIDNDCKCHVSNDGTMREVEAPEFFNGKTRAFIEGYRYVPVGEIWTREDGQVFEGEMIAPWHDYELLAEFQAIYEEEQAKATAEIAALVEEVYNSDMEVIENV